MEDYAGALSCQESCARTFCLYHCFVLLPQGWGSLKPIPPAALESSSTEVSAFTFLASVQRFQAVCWFFPFYTELCGSSHCHPLNFISFFCICCVCVCCFVSWPVSITYLSLWVANHQWAYVCRYKLWDWVYFNSVQDDTVNEPASQLLFDMLLLQTNHEC